MAIHHSHIHVSSDSPVPLFCDHPGIRTKGAYHSLLPISIPKTNPIPMLSSPFTSYTQPELWMHSPLIHRMSYLSSGTIATECSMAQSYSRQEKMFCSHKAVGHCIQQHQPSSLSLLHMKSSSLFVEKLFRLLCVWLSVEMEFLLLQCNWQPEQMTSRICACCHCVSMLICRLSFVCSPWSGIN